MHSISTNTIARLRKQQKRRTRSALTAFALVWRKTDANGNYPPPPLNGSAHAWHHPLSISKRTIAMGGAPFGGAMPGFAQTLSEEEISVVIAYFQNFWSDEIYARWLEIDSR